MTATDTDGSLVCELDGRPAFDAWADAVRDRVRERFDADVDALGADSPLLTQIMGEFELGVDQGDSYKVRWPRIDPDDERSLRISVDVSEGTVFRVMHGHPDDQIESAHRVTRSAVEMLEGEPAGGFETYGETCLRKGQTSGFHNTTTVVLLFPE